MVVTGLMCVMLTVCCWVATGASVHQNTDVFPLGLVLLWHLSLMVWIWNL